MGGGAGAGLGAAEPGTRVSHRSGAGLGAAEPGTGVSHRPAHGTGAGSALASPRRLVRLQTGKGVCVKSGGREQSVLLFSMKALGFVTAPGHCPEASKVPLQNPKVT